MKRIGRLIFAKEFISKEQIWWNDVIFADESKFNIFGSDGRKIIWRKSKRRIQTEKFEANTWRWKFNDLELYFK